jgi:adenylate cyclase
LAAWLGGTQWAQALEWKPLAWRVQLRAEAGQPAPDERLLVIGVGDRSTINIEPWPFRRAYHAQLQRLVAPEKPRGLIWDIIYQNRVDFEGKPLDALSDDDFAVSTDHLAGEGISTVFAAVSGEAPTGDDLTKLGITEPLTRVEGDRERIYGDAHLSMPFPGLRNAGLIGTVDAPRGAGGIVRRMPMVLRVGDVVLPSLTLQGAMRYWNLGSEDVQVNLGDEIILGGAAGGRRIPIDEEGMLLINYRYGPMRPGEPLGTEIPTVEYFDLLIDLHQKHVVQAPDARDPVPLGDRIVLVGEFATDSGPTPRSDNSPLVYLHANVLNNILQSDYVRPVSAAWIWWGALALGLVGAVLARRAAVMVAMGYTLGVTALYLVAAQWAWQENNWWLPVVAPVAGFLFLQFFQIAYRVWMEQRAKAEIRGMFGSYLSPVVVRQMVETEAKPELGGVTEEITAYFSDIQGFSAFSELLSAAQLVELLNEYLTACTDIIQEELGTLDKYIGDAVVAMYGAPLELPDHAYRACVAALRVQERLGELRGKWTNEGDKWPRLVQSMRTRIGLNTGPCMIGNMGSRSRFSYTMMGDDVNLAARMESGAKSWGVYIMLTEQTRRACEATEGMRPMVFRSLGRIRVKGRQQPVPIHELMGWADEVTDEEKEGLAEFSRGLECFYRQEWEWARTRFQQAAKTERLQPGHAQGVSLNPSLAYQQIIEEMMAQPPPEDWDGVYSMRNK